MVQRIGAQKVGYYVQDVRVDRIRRRVREQGEERKEERGLMVDAAIVGGDIVVV